jgi:hypothetical protein
VDVGADGGPAAWASEHPAPEGEPSLQTLEVLQRIIIAADFEKYEINKPT